MQGVFWRTEVRPTVSAFKEKLNINTELYINVGRTLVRHVVRAFKEKRNINTELHIDVGRTLVRQILYRAVGLFEQLKIIFAMTHYL